MIRTYERFRASWPARRVAELVTASLKRRREKPAAKQQQSTGSPPVAAGVSAMPRLAQAKPTPPASTRQLTAAESAQAEVRAAEKRRLADVKAACGNDAEFAFKQSVAGATNEQAARAYARHLKAQELVNSGKISPSLAKFAESIVLPGDSAARTSATPTPTPTARTADANRYADDPNDTPRQRNLKRFARGIVMPKPK